jgi:hypothetical protein
MDSKFLEKEDQNIMTRLKKIRKEKILMII